MMHGSADVPGEALGPILVERVLRCASASEQRLSIRFGLPRESDVIDWVCPYQIDGLGRSNVELAHGVDALQALLMAIEAVRVQLDSSNVVCHWEGGEEGDHGIPRTIPSYFGIGFSSRISRLIDEEVETFAANLSRGSTRD